MKEKKHRPAKPQKKQADGTVLLAGIEQRSTDPSTKFKPTKLQAAPFNPRTKAQAEAIQTVREHDLTFLIGPAGTAKTFIAAAVATEDFISGRAKRIVIARPAVEAGDQIGYLKGGMFEKMLPYVKPFLENLEKYVGAATIKRLCDVGIIEVTSFTYLRGRTFDDAVLVLDEVQNATMEQLKLGLTRPGENCRVIVTGDPSQIDLEPAKRKFSAAHDLHRFRGRRGIGFVDLDIDDVQRSRLVRTVLEAYEDKPKTRRKGII